MNYIYDINLVALSNGASLDQCLFQFPIALLNTVKTAPGLVTSRYQEAPSLRSRIRGSVCRSVRLPWLLRITAETLVPAATAFQRGLEDIRSCEAHPGFLQEVRCRFPDTMH